MKNKKVIAIMVTGFVAIILVASGIIASAPPDAGDPPVESRINYQGQLTDDAGNPLDGPYDMEFRIYDVELGGAALWSEPQAVTVVNGLFTVQLGRYVPFPAGLFDGSERYLEIVVNGEVLQPRQRLISVPYAIKAEKANDADTLDGLDSSAFLSTGEDWGRPGVTSNLYEGSSTLTDRYVNQSGDSMTGSSSEAVLSVTNSGSGPGGEFKSSSERGVHVSSAGSDGVHVSSAGSSGFCVLNAGYNGLWVIGAGSDGVRVDSAGSDGFYVYHAGDNGVRVEMADDNGVHVYIAYNDGVHVHIAYNDGVRVEWADGDGVHVDSAGLHGIDVHYAAADGFHVYTAGRDGLRIYHAERDYIRAGTDYDLDFEVTYEGEVYADGTFHSGGADFAEMLPAVEGLEPGEVLVVGPDGKLARSAQPCATNVVGVYSTSPGFVGGDSDDEDITGKVPLAVVGMVPVKASTENGAIMPGDLLTTAFVPGHAMKATDVKVGTIIGKALESLDEGTGMINMLVMLQ